MKVWLDENKIRGTIHSRRTHKYSSQIVYHRIVLDVAEDYFRHPDRVSDRVSGLCGKLDTNYRPGV